MLTGSTFVHNRTLAHPPATVFAAFASAPVLATWWGPAGFSNRFERCDFQPGGRWVFTMIGPDGTEYPNRCVFQAIEPDRRVVIRHVVAPLFTLTVTLWPTPGGTRLDWAQAFDDEATAQALAHIVAPANEQNLDRLQAALAMPVSPD